MGNISEQEMYLIDSFEIHIAVEPIHHALTNTRGEEVKHGTTSRWVRTDNLARIRRVVCFSPDNHLMEPFRFLRYQTQNGGAIREPITSDPNEADAFDRGLYADHGMFYVYQLTPQAGKEYSLEFELLKGFDRDHRQTHFHLPRPSRMRQVVLTLDLSKYLTSGFSIVQIPTLYLHREEPHSHDFCTLRGVGSSVDPRHRGPRWEWVVEDLQGGVVDVCWDFTSPRGFEEIVGPAAARGLELMADRTLDLQEELQHFYQIGLACLNPDREGVFSFNEMASEIGLIGRYAGKDLSREMDRVSELFANYFRAYGHLPEREPFETATDDDPSLISEAWKIIDRHQRTRPRICSPVGCWAWELTREFLTNRNLLPTYAKSYS